MEKRDAQLMLEGLYYKNQLMPRLREEFSENPTFEEGAQEDGLPPGFATELLVQMHLHKRAGIQTLTGLLNHFFDGDMQATADALGWAAENDLIDWDPEAEIFLVIFEASPASQHALEQFQYPIPMIVPPLTLKKNTDSMYLSCKSGSVLLGGVHHEEDVWLEHLNRMNRMKFRLNVPVLQMISNSWKNLDKRKPGESDIEFKKRRRAFAKYDRAAYGVMDILLDNTEDFHLGHKYDKRGRTYCQG